MSDYKTESYSLGPIEVPADPRRESPACGTLMLTEVVTLNL
jgi:hypothetical protein